MREALAGWAGRPRPSKNAVPLRLTGIDYGELISFEGSEIKEANVVEQVSQLSTELYINTLDLRLILADAEFSIFNPTGDFAGLTEQQPLAVYEIVNNTARLIGNFYLDEWENVSDTEYLFRAIDLLGVLDRQIYKGGIWLGAGIALEDLIDDILTEVTAPYELDSNLVGTVITGWLPVCSSRSLAADRLRRGGIGNLRPIRSDQDLRHQTRLEM